MQRISRPGTLHREAVGSTEELKSETQKRKFRLEGIGDRTGSTNRYEL
jgi:hypothetical protein